MTPDAVIYRYLEIVSNPECDIDKLCLLLSTDADLLSRWLKLLNVPADMAALRQPISVMGGAEFNVIAQAQAWSVLPIVGSARLSVDQWLSVLRAACLAEVMAHHLALENIGDKKDAPRPDSSVRLRTLLAISGVDLPQDQKLKRLIEFRGTSPDLLEDASDELRIFAVVDAIELGQSATLAKGLLGLSAEVYAALSEQADAQALNLARELNIDLSGEGDWAHRIWLRQQIDIAAASLKEADTLDTLFDAHVLASRSLFSLPPHILLSREGSAIKLLQSDEFSIAANSQTSVIARTLRDQQPARMTDSNALAVVDRLLLRTLDVDDGIAIPLDIEGGLAVILAGVSDEDESELVAHLYAQTLTVHLQRVLTQPTEANDDAKLEQFKTSEYNRLREIVHEANNPLSIVHNYLHILELKLQHEPEAVEQLQLISSELRRAGEVFTQARDIPNEIEVDTPPAGIAVELDAVTWAARLAEITRGMAQNQGVELVTRFPSEPVLLVTQVDKLAQIMSNLLKNAIEASPEDAIVVLGVRRGVVRSGRIGIELYVEDQAGGLPAEVLLNLQRSKTSTKGGDHQGLGLKIAFDLTNELDGALDVRTEPDHGSVFSLFLPQRD